jgi:hypothetical protein
MREEAADVGRYTSKIWHDKDYPKIQIRTVEGLMNKQSGWETWTKFAPRCKKSNSRLHLSTLTLKRSSGSPATRLRKTVMRWIWNRQLLRKPLRGNRPITETFSYSKPSPQSRAVSISDVHFSPSYGRFDELRQGIISGASVSISRRRPHSVIGNLSLVRLLTLLVVAIIIRITVVRAAIICAGATSQGKSSQTFPCCECRFRPRPVFLFIIQAS